MISTNVKVTAFLGVQNGVIIGDANGGDMPLEIMADVATNTAIKIDSSSGSFCKLMISDIATCNPPIPGSTMIGTANNGKALCMLCGTNP